MGGYAVDPNQQQQQRINPMDRFLTGALYPSVADAQQQPPQQPPQQPMPDLSMSGNQADSSYDMLGAGKMVTQPTLAMVGEKGPEAVVPLTDQPGAKVTPAMLGGTARTRWQHPMGPNAAKRTSPLRSNLPLKPNGAFR